MSTGSEDSLSFFRKSTKGGEWRRHYGISTHQQYLEDAILVAVVSLVIESNCLETSEDTGIHQFSIFNADIIEIGTESA